MVGDLFKKLVHELLLIVKICAFDAVEGIGEVEKTVLGGQGQDSESSRHSEPFAPRGDDSFPIIHQKQIGVELNSKSDCVFFAGLEIAQRRIENMHHRTYFYPCRGLCDPLLDHGRSF